MLSIRPATPLDAPQAAELIALTANVFGDIVFGFGNHSRAVKALAFFFSQPQNRFSFEHASMALMDGQIAGLLVAFPGGQMDALTYPMIWLVLREYGLIGSLRLVIGSRQALSGKEAEDGEYHIAHVATFPDLQGSGIGTELMRFAETQAQEKGFSRCSLVVDLLNPGARRLYERLGYQPIEIFHSPQLEERFHTTGYMRMVKLL